MSLRKLLWALIILSSTTSFCQKPNVLLIITDDQGYGDLGLHGNPHIHTPVLDELGRRSIRFTDFYVSPVCAPTRSSLMTGRYSLRTGVRDTYNGGAIMASSEITLAELLKGIGYKTGIFGKWHLGDNYPSRPNDQGFDYSLIHHSGGMGQVGDIETWYKKDSSYFDPNLWVNGSPKSFQGYCTDIFTEEAIRFIGDSKKEPFFCYLAFNAPHTPLQVPKKYLEKYQNINPEEGFEDLGMTNKNIEDARKVYAMVENIDYNVGRVLEMLDSNGQLENTIIIFMTDNGPQQKRFVDGMRERKGSVFRGGVRVPFFISYPNKITTAGEVMQTAAHIDVLPTLSTLCGFEAPNDRKIDGMDLSPWLFNEFKRPENRELFFTWTRRLPIKYSNVAYQKGDYRLVGNTTFNADISQFEFFNYRLNPSEDESIVLENLDLAKTYKKQLDLILDELLQSPNLIERPKIIIGSEKEPISILNRNDASGQRGIWDQEEVYGFWEIDLLEGKYDIELVFVKPPKIGDSIQLEFGNRVLSSTISESNQIRHSLKNVQLPAFTGSFVPTLNERTLPFYVKFIKK